MQTPSAQLAVSPLKVAERKAQDVAFGVIFVLMFIATVAILIFSGSNASGTLNEVMSCANVTSSSRFVHASVGYLRDEDDPNKDMLVDVLRSAKFLAASFGLAVFAGVVWMLLLRYFAKPMVYATLMVQGVVLIGLGLYLGSVARSSCTLTTGDCTSAFMPFLLCGLGALYFLWLCCARRRIALTAKLLEQAVVVVSTHPGLFLASGLLLLVKALFMLLIAVASLFLLASTITVTTLPDGQCEVASYPTRADEAAWLVLGVFFYWSTMFWLSVKFYMTSMTTGVWYYETASLAAQEGAISDKEHVRHPVCVSLKCALTTGFGTVAFASLIVTLCEMLKSMARQQARDNGWLGCLIACCVMCIANWLEFLTSFALTYAALTGDAFCTSGKTFLDHCSRHGLLKVVVVDYLASITLNMGALVFGGLVAALTIGMVDSTVLSGPAHDDDRAGVLAVAGSAAAVIAFIVLAFIASILLNVVDAAYSCIVIDLDNHARVGTFYRPEIAHAVISKVKPELVVVQPGGAYAVAQPPEVAFARAVP